MLTTTLRLDDVTTISRIGADRAPAEACGVILPSPHHDRRVWELPNRSLTPHDTFVLHGDDLKLELEQWLRANPTQEAIHNMIIWHTHPKGQTGPSESDIEGRFENCCNLIVSLTDDGPIPTFF